jgi:hypothetical protein
VQDDWRVQGDWGAQDDSPGAEGRFPDAQEQFPDARDQFPDGKARQHGTPQRARELPTERAPGAEPFQDR